MKPSLDQLCEQFGRLVAPTPSAARPAAEAAAAPVAGPASESSAGLRPADQAAKMAALPPQPPPAAPAGPIQRTDYAAKGYHFDATVAPPQVVVAAEIFDKNGFGLDAVTGVDWIAQQEMEIVYDYFHPEANLRAVVRTRVPRANPELPTISPVFPGANWHERETHDFFGIRFLGHPNLTPLLLPEDATFHPLRKDYQP
jgi:NADH-quinone oxidoreductase subunit C